MINLRLFSSLCLCEFRPQSMKDIQHYEFSVQIFHTAQARAWYLSAWQGLVHLTLNIVVSTSIGVCFQIPCHASILVFIVCLFSMAQQSKEEANLSPRILALTSFIFQFSIFIFCASSVQHFNCF